MHGLSTGEPKVGVGPPVCACSSSCYVVGVVVAGLTAGCSVLVVHPN